MTTDWPNPCPYCACHGRYHHKDCPWWSHIEELNTEEEAKT